MEKFIDKGLEQLLNYGPVVFLLVLAGFFLGKGVMFFFRKWEDRTNELIKEKESRHIREMQLKDEQIKNLVEKHELYDELIKISREQLGKSDMAYTAILTDLKRINEDGFKRINEFMISQEKTVQDFKNSQNNGTRRTTKK
jgi:Na+/phosphate symporter